MPDNNYFDKYDTNDVQQATQTTGQPTANTNYFDKYDVAPGSGGTPPEQNPSAVGDSGAFMAGVDNFNRVFGRQAEGVLGAINYVANKAFGGDKDLQQFQQQLDAYTKQQDEIAAQSAARYPKAAMAGTLGAMVAEAIPLGMGATAKTGASLAQKAISGFGGNAALGFLTTPGDFDTRMANGLVAGALGGGVPIATEGYLSAAKQIGATLSPAVQKGSGIISRIISPEKAATKDITAELVNSGTAENALANQAKFDALNVPATAVDTSASPGLAAELKNIPMDIQKRGLVSSVRNPQIAAAQKAIDNTLDDFVPGGYDKNVQARNLLYSQMENKIIPDDVQQQLLSNPSISSRLKDINNNIDLQLNGIPDNSLTKLNSVKQAIDSDLWTNTKQLKTGERTSLQPAEAQALKRTRSDLVNILDQIYPEYKAMRQAGERVHYYDLFKDSLQKPAFKAGADNKLTLDQIYSTLFGTPEKQEFFLNAVQRTKGNVQNTKNLMDVLNLVKSSTLDKLLGTAEGKAAGSLTPQGVLTKFSDWVAKARYQDALLQLTLGPKWQEPLAKALNRNSLKDKILYLTNLIQDVAKSKEPTINKLNKVLPLPLSSSTSNTSN